MLGIDPAQPWLAGAPGAAACGGAAIGPLRARRSTRSCSRTTASSWPPSTTLPAVALPDLGLLFAPAARCTSCSSGPSTTWSCGASTGASGRGSRCPCWCSCSPSAPTPWASGSRAPTSIVNQLAIVRARPAPTAASPRSTWASSRPTDSTYDVAVADDALLANPVYLRCSPRAAFPWTCVGRHRPRSRGYQVGFGVLRAFRAEAPVDVPRVDADLTYRRGCSRARSPTAPTRRSSRWRSLGRRRPVIPSLAPGETVEVDSTSTGARRRHAALAAPSMASRRRDRAHDRARAHARRCDQMTGYSDTLGQLRRSRRARWSWPGRPDRPSTSAPAASPARRATRCTCYPPRRPHRVTVIDPQRAHRRTALDPRRTRPGTSSSICAQPGHDGHRVPADRLRGCRSADGLVTHADPGGYPGADRSGLALEPLPPDQQPGQDDPVEHVARRRPRCSEVE